MAKKGIDISYCQKGLDLADAKAAGVEFAIIRAGYHFSADTELKNHINGAEKNNIPYGFYWYSRAFSAVEAKSEAKSCIETIKNYNLTYPVFYDMEDKDQIEGLTAKERTDIICTFCEEVKAAGYTAGVYLNPSWLENYVDKSRIIGNYELWLAHWTEDPNKPSKYNYGQVMWQWGLDHIGKFDVDGDLCFKEYIEKEPEKPVEPVEPVEPKPDKTKSFLIGTVVKFSGGKQYIASNSDQGYPAKAGIVRISLKANGTLHPYHVISEDGSGVYGWVDADTISEYKAEPAFEEIHAIALDVIAGKWGNGEERKKSLINAGYDYDAVQAEVNRVLSTLSN